LHDQLPDSDGKAMNKVLLVNLGSPELDHLAIELAARGELHGVVRRYVNKGRSWERMLASLPLVGRAYTATLGRRLPPSGLDGDRVIEAGRVADFGFALVSRLSRIWPGIATGLARRLLARTEKSVAQDACDHVPRVDIVVANYHVALPAFTLARSVGRRTILNYPIAHHRWQYRYYSEQAIRRPAYAAALPSFGDVEEHAAALDLEIEMADTILVGSQFAHDTFVSEGIPSEKIRIIPYGVDISRFVPREAARPAAQPFRVLYVGQIGERKGASYLLEAFKSFQKPDTELHLVGDYVGDGAVYGRFASLFRHTPNMPQVMLPKAFQEADVFVLPTLVEGMGMVVLEAMACGLPVIVTSRGPSEVVRHEVDGFVIPACDSDAIAMRLQQLYEDRELLRRQGANAREQAARWSWKRYAKTAADAVLAD
jgi:glycosyltransferase involved in cell wall biosynthesis